MEETQAGDKVWAGVGSTHKPPIDCLPRKHDHPLSNSSGGGFSPWEVLLRVTRGVPSFPGDSMLG